MLLLLFLKNFCCFLIDKLWVSVNELYLVFLYILSMVLDILVLIICVFILSMLGFFVWNLVIDIVIEYGFWFDEFVVD